MSPENMERMGFVRICKEAAQLLRHHFRLFLPFVLAFHLPASFLSVFYNAFLAPENPYSNVLNLVYTTGHGEELKVTDDVEPSGILSFVVLASTFILTTLGVLAFTYVVDHIYSDLSDDDAITRRGFKLLPHAFLRVFVTLIWVNLVVLLLTAACGLLAVVLFVLFALVSGVNDPSPAVFVPLFLLPLVVGTVALSIVFALAQSVAVLEPENYGRKALEQSRRYARGRAWTVFRMLAFSYAIAASFNAHAHAVATAGLSPATEVVVVIAMSVVFSFVSAYVVLVQIVTYFVCKSSSDVAALPITAAENPYKPVDSGSSQIGEP